MKKTRMFIAMFAILLSAAPATAAETAALPGHTIQVKVKGLVCDYCVRALEKMFRKRPEVQDFSVDLGTKVISVRFKDGQSLDDETVQQIIRDSGYAVEEIHKVERK